MNFKPLIKIYHIKVSVIFDLNKSCRYEVAILKIRSPFLLMICSW